MTISYFRQNSERCDLLVAPPSVVEYNQLGPQVRASNQDKIYRVLAEHIYDVGELYDGLVVLAATPLAIDFIFGERQRNPFDDPPGIGYKALKTSGAYIPQTNFYHYSFAMNAGVFQQIPVNWAGDYYLGTRKIRWSPPAGTSLFGWSFYIGDKTQSDQLLADLKETALRNLYGDLNKRVQVNGGVILAELKETIGLLGTAVLTILRLGRAIKSCRLKEAVKIIAEYSGSEKNLSGLLDRRRTNVLRKRRGAKPLSKADYAANAWLELNFGWLPIIDDVVSLCNYIDGLIDSDSAEETLFSFSGYMKYQYAGSHVPRPEVTELNKEWENSLSNATSTVWDYDACEGISTFKVGINTTWKPESSILNILNSIGLANPAAVAWEIVPFSFVVDWFIPINRWLESLSATIGLKLMDYSESVKLDQVVQFKNVSCNYVHREWDNSIWLEKVPYLHLKDINVHTSIMKRNVFNYTTIPPFPVTTTKLIDILQPWKLVTAVALGKQLSRRH